MIRDHAQCLFASAPVADCGREVILPASVLASTWPLAMIGLGIFGWAVWILTRDIVWPSPIDWEQEREPKPLRPIEDIARDSGL